MDIVVRHVIANVFNFMAAEYPGDDGFSAVIYQILNEHVSYGYEALLQNARHGDNRNFF